jgi:SAM-dependent methyltransferase
MNHPEIHLPDPLPKRINIGCGYDVREGFLNVDLHSKHSPDLVADATSLPMLPSGYFDEVLAQDVLEHLERDRTQPALDEWARLLSPDGVLIIRVPSLLDMFEMLSAPEYRQFEQAQKVVHLMYGTQAYTGDYHLAGFTPALLDGYLHRAGLSLCESSLLHGWLFDIRVRKSERPASSAEFVHAAYFRILGRPVDAAGLAHHTHALESGVTTREELEKLLRDCEEGRFVANNPSYLVRHRSRLSNAPFGSVERMRSLARKFSARVRSALRR